MDPLEAAIEKRRLRNEQELALLRIPSDLQPELPRVPVSQRNPRSLRHLVVRLLRERDGTKCYLCDTELDVDQSFIEHIIPISRGGTNEPENVALACGSCNQAKSDNFVSFYLTSKKPRYHLPRRGS